MKDSSLLTLHLHDFGDIHFSLKGMVAVLGGGIAACVAIGALLAHIRSATDVQAHRQLGAVSQPAR